MKLQLKHMLKDTLRLALVLSLALTAITYIMPAFANAFTQDVTTARSNETNGDKVLGGIPTRVTWEGVVDVGESIKEVTLQFPDGSNLTNESSAKVTLLEGTKRLSVNPQVSIDTSKSQVNVVFEQPIEEGVRLRIENYDVALPNVSGQVSLTGSYVRDSGEVTQLGNSPSIEVSQSSLTQGIVDWLDAQPAVQAWNSVNVLNTFLKPQLIISSIPTVFTGWLISLLLVCIGFPLAIPIGLIAAFMKLSRLRILHILAAIYTGVVRGTPLFLQIYLAFFGLPQLGINLDQYLLAILVMAFNSGAYMCEILRAGIQSIPKGQFEASRSLGMSGAQTMFFVILPQTVRRVLPTMTSEFILLYKDTSLLAAVGLMELMLYARSAVANTGNMTPYIVAAAFYLIVTLPLTHLVTRLEKRLSASEGAQQKSKRKQKTLRKNRRDAFKMMKDEITGQKNVAEADEGQTVAEQAAAEHQNAPQADAEKPNVKKMAAGQELTEQATQSKGGKNE